MALSGRKLLDASETHAIAVKRLENRARDEIDAAYAQLASRAKPADIAIVFRTLGEISEKVIGKYGRLAVKESKRYTGEAYGLVGVPRPVDLAAPVTDAVAMVSEYTRHTQAILEIRVTRMRQSGMGVEPIAAWVQGDLRAGGRIFGAYRNGIKHAVAGAIQGLAQVQAMSAFRPRRENADAA